MDLTEKQWTIVEALLPEAPSRPTRRGRPRRSDRDVLNGVLWVMRTGATWRDMPWRYPPYPTCHRRFTEWLRDGTFGRMIEALSKDLQERGNLTPDESTQLSALSQGDAFEASEKKTATGAKGGKSWQWSTAMVFLSPSVLRHLSPSMRQFWQTFFANISSDVGARQLRHVISESQLESAF